MSNNKTLWVDPNTITYSIPVTFSRSCIAKTIKVSPSVMQIAHRQFNIESVKALQKMAGEAKHKGLNLDLLTENTYKDFKLDYDDYKWLKANSPVNINKEITYFFKGCFWIFNGKNNKSLKSLIVPENPIESDSSTRTKSVIDDFFSNTNAFKVTPRRERFYKGNKTKR